jgi:hypothetical protein
MPRPDRLAISSAGSSGNCKETEHAHGELLTQRRAERVMLAHYCCEDSSQYSWWRLPAIFIWQLLVVLA